MTTLLADMLRMPAVEAGPLADAIDARTNGNPYDTVELVNALRRDGALTPTADDWAWDAGTLRRHLGAGDVIDLLHARIDTLPLGTRRLLEAMACLGGELPIPVLATATAMAPEIAEKTLLPALEDGLLVMVAETGDVRFRHDRVQQAALARVDPSRRVADRLQLARRLAARPRFGHLAAEQYLHGVAHLTDPAEIDRVIQLFRAAAAHARSLAGHVQVEQYMAAATELARDAQVDSDMLVDLATERHAALFNLGRSDEVDQVFDWITELTTDPLRVAPATWVQISSLTDTGRPGAALALGRDLLGRLGLPPPEGPEATGAAIGAGTAAMYGWAGHGDAEQDLARPEYDDPIASALARTIDRLLMPAYWADHATMAWLIVESARMWADHGPHPVLIGMLGHAPVVTVSAGEDYRTGATLARRALVVGEARGYEPATSQGRFWYVMNAGPWWDPLETVVQEARRAREGLIRGGELHFVPHSFYPCLTALTDCAATLEDLSVEVDAALAVSARNSNEVAEVAFLSMRQLIRALHGETDEPGGFTDAVFDEAAHLARLAHNPPAAMTFHYLRAMSAALFDDAQALERHSAAAMELLPFATANYPSAVIRLIRGLALANRARATEDDADRSALLAELAQLRAWMDARAADAPSNFRHLVSLLDAERAWAEGRFEAAAVAFDTARRQVGERRRPWHEALITERAARFHLDRGIRLGGLSLLAEALAVYAAWGADGKVADLEASFPGLPAAATGWAPGGTRAGIRRSGVMSSTQIDLLGVLKASQALSSETNLDRLRHRVGEVLSALTGATAVQLVLWNHDAQAWFVPSAEAGEPALSLQAAADRRLLPLSAFHYTERTREPLVVDDVTQDYRFNRDPYLAAMDICSLLLVPILNRGELPGVLILENRLSRAAFSSDRLDTVMLIAGQLAVSLDNALLYASLEQKVAERTDALAEANTRLQVLSITDPLTGLANRRRMADVLEAEWQRAQVTGQPMAVAMVDVDHFKPYNDLYGHPAGDLCLRRIAAILNECVRSTDLVVRYGGEEFMLILPGADARAAQEVAQRARDAVVALQQPHQQSDLGVVTVSIGVTSAHPSAHLSPEELIEAADHQLYSAKRAGRNQVRVGQVS
jgi:diguanylate cyclase (GGDEF)-like protein